MSNLVDFPSERQLCHWCADYRRDVETLVLSPRGADKFHRTTLKICHYCVESWLYWAQKAERNPKTRFKRMK